MPDALTKLKEKQDAVMLSINRATQEYEQLTKEIDKSKTLDIEFDKIITEKENQLLLIDEKLKKGNEELVKLSKQIETAKGNDTDYDLEIEKKKSELLEVTAEITEVTTQQGNTIEGYRQETIKLKQERDNELDELNRIENTLLQNNKMIAKGNESLERRKDDLMIQVQGLESEVNTLTSLIVEKKQKSEGIDAEILKKEEIIKKLDEDIKTKHKDILEIEKDSEKAKLELVELENEKEKIKQSQISLAERDLQLRIKDEEIRQAFDRWSLSYDGTTYPTPVKYSQAEYVELKAKLKEKENEIRAKFKELNIPYEG